MKNELIQHSISFQRNRQHYKSVRQRQYCWLVCFPNNCSKEKYLLAHLWNGIIKDLDKCGVLVPAVCALRREMPWNRVLLLWLLWVLDFAHGSRRRHPHHLQLPPGGNQAWPPTLAFTSVLLPSFPNAEAGSCSNSLRSVTLRFMATTSGWVERYSRVASVQRA